MSFDGGYAGGGGGYPAGDGGGGGFDGAGYAASARPYGVVPPGPASGYQAGLSVRSQKLGPRVSLQVSYLTSGQYSSHGMALHFFQVSEGGSKPQKQKRLLVLADRATFVADFESQMNRCMLISRIEEMGLFEEHLRPLMGPMSQYDLALQNTMTVDIIRMIPCVFSTRDATQSVCMYELEENQPLAKKVNCKPAMLQRLDGSMTKEQHDEVIKSMRRTNQVEVAKLREMLQQQKDEQLTELIDARTQIEQLRHSLSLLESERFLAHQGQAGGAPFHAVKEEAETRRLPPPPPPREAHEDRDRSREEELYRPRSRRDEYRDRDRDYDREYDRDRDYRAPPPPRSGSPTTVNIYTSAGAAQSRNRAGELVDNLSRELEANARYLDQLQTRDRPRDRRAERDYDRDYPPHDRPRDEGRDSRGRYSTRDREREFDGRRTPGRRSGGRARTPKSDRKGFGSPPQSGRNPEARTPQSSRGTRRDPRAGWR